jgi:hypothetical protein
MFFLNMVCLIAGLAKTILQDACVFGIEDSLHIVLLFVSRLASISFRWRRCFQSDLHTLKSETVISNLSICNRLRRNQRSDLEM